MAAVKKITSIAGIPMECTACGWKGNESQCAAVSPREFVHGKITASCPNCPANATQSEDCTYQFIRKREERS